MDDNESSRFGRDEILFTVAVGGLVAMTVAAIVWEREPSAVLVTAFCGLLGLPVFLSSERK